MHNQNEKQQANQLLLFRSILLVIVFIVFLSETRADSVVPESDSTVVATLSPTVIAIARSVRAQQQQEKAMRGDNTASDNGVSLEAIVQSYTLATRDNDPRAFGHTLALIDSWPGSQSRPVLLRLIHASILQHNHDFDLALQQLKVVLSEDASNLQALLIAAQIGLVMADYEAVATHCAAMRRSGASVYALNCQAQLRALTGEAEQALAVTESALLNTPLNPVQQTELHLTAALVAERLGQSGRAVNHYRSVLRANPRHLFTQLRLAGLYLQQRAPDEVRQILAAYRAGRGELEAKILLLRADAMGGYEPDSTLAATVSAEIDALTRLQEEAPHKLLAQYQLFINKDYDAAVQAARRNWATQKEPSDALLLAEAAIAAADQEALRSVADWVVQTGLQDTRLQALLDASFEQAPASVERGIL